MKPASFEYRAPTTLDEALEHMAEHGWDAKALAGGQSLVPMMNFRLSQPSVIVDLNSVSELFYIRADDNGGLRLGAMTRQRQVEHDPLVAQRAPLVHETMPYIAAVHETLRSWQDEKGAWPLKGWMIGNSGADQGYPTAFATLLLSVPGARLSIFNRRPPELPAPAKVAAAD